MSLSSVNHGLEEVSFRFNQSVDPLKEMDVKGRGSNSMIESCEEDMDLRRGPWTVEEDITLINYIADHGDGRWNSLARCAGLKRSGKSCRLRWLNYLRPDVRRGNITLEEQLLILELHSCWGNRWSKIAQHLPGRTDNEIKNYWRTRVQKHAKQLKCDVNSKQFKDTMRYLWMPRLVERIQSAAATSSSAASAVPLMGGSGGVAATPLTPNYNLDFHEGQHTLLPPMVHQSYTPENSSTGASSDSFGTHVSTDSDMTDFYYVPVDNNHIPDDFGASQLAGGYPESSFTSPPMAGFNHDQGTVNVQVMNHQHEQAQWVMDGNDSMADDFWNVDDVWFLQQHQQQ